MKNELLMRTLTERFFEGTTTVEEEQQLYRLYQSADVPEDLRPYRQMLLDLAAIGNQPADILEHEGTTGEVASVPRRRRHIWHWVAAASIAVMAVAGATWLLSTANEDECVAYIYGKKTTDPDVVMAEVSQTTRGLLSDGVQDDVGSMLNEMFE